MDKPFKTYGELVQLMALRGLRVDGKTEFVLKLVLPDVDIDSHLG